MKPKVKSNDYLLREALNCPKKKFRHLRGFSNDAQVITTFGLVREMVAQKIV